MSGTSGTTELGAVNTMLTSIGSTPINSLTGAQTADGVIAKNILDEVRRAVLAQGWAFNSEIKRVVPIDGAGAVAVADNILSIDVTDGYNTDVDAVQRGAIMYDRKNHTAVFAKDLTCDVIYNLELADIPETARRYVTIRSARVLHDRVIGSQNEHLYSLQDEMFALGDLKEHESSTGDYSIFGHWDIQRIINRGSPIDTVGF